MNGTRESLVKALCLVFLVVLGAAASAQERAQMADRLQMALGLSEEQTAKVEKILAEQGQKRRSVAQEARAAGDRMAAREKMQAVAAETQELLSGVLNEEQMSKYRELVSARRARQGRAGQGRPGGRVPQAESTE